MISRPVNPQLTIKQESEIGGLAEWIAEDMFPNANRIEPLEIAGNAKIGVIPGRYADAFDGMLEHESGRFLVYCNLDRVESITSSRARFTLAHELGHYYIDDHRNALESGHAPKHPSYCDHESKNPVEIEADCFASCLLMPSQKFRRQARKSDLGLRGICQLANSFGTSLTSTAIRYAKLDIMQCVIIKWDSNGYGWKWLSPSAFARGLRKTIETQLKLVPNSATERIMSDPTSCTGVVSMGSTAGHWFPFVQNGSTQDFILKEEAISLGRFGVLTLLTPLNE